MTVEQSEPMPNMPPPQAKTPGIVLVALLLSIFGITGITAVLGIILGFIGRGKAKQAGKGSGMALAAIIIGAAWLVVIAFGALLGGSDSTEPSSTEQVVVEEESVQSESVPVTGSIGTLEVTSLTNCLGSDGTGTWSGEDETGAFWGACMTAPSVTEIPTKVRCTMTGYGADGTQLDQFTFEGGVSKTQAILSFGLPNGLTNNVDAAIATAIEIVTADCSEIS